MGMKQKLSATKNISDNYQTPLPISRKNSHSELVTIY